MKNTSVPLINIEPFLKGDEKARGIVELQPEGRLFNNKGTGLASASL